MKQQTPIAWLLSAIEVINSGQKDPPFKVVYIGPTGESCRVLLRNNGALWHFTARVEREPAE